MRPIKRAIILCWIMLVACFAIKLFGGNWFEVVCTNEHFSNLCDFVQNNKFAFFTLSFFTYIFPSSFIILSVSGLPKPSKNQLATCVLTMFGCWLLVFVSLNLKSVIEFVFMCILPAELNLIGFDGRIVEAIKKTWYRGFVGYAVVFVFQLISILTRNAMPNIADSNVLVISIMLIDYYIMAVLFYLYIKLKKGER